MSLDIHQREREGIVILDMNGRLIVGEATAKLRACITDNLAADRKDFIFEMRHVDFIDSSGLGGVVICFTAVQKAGGKIKLVNLTKRNIELLVLTKLTTVFETFDDEQEAVNSFFPNREVRRFDILSFVQEQQREEQSK